MAGGDGNRRDQEGGENTGGENRNWRAEHFDGEVQTQRNGSTMESARVTLGMAPSNGGNGA